ncbi:serine O-acetyltransferase EpsC [Sphingomonas bacterium]|uniref:serine O-acetyltransferase EpsC n=1 Tax=Sphingomonas bacterium TaxID=1895847 RepID=UPI003F68B482
MSDHLVRGDTIEQADQPPGDLADIAAGLRAARRRWREAHHRHLEVGVDGFPSRQRIEAAVTDLCAALFPQRLGEAHGEADEDAYVDQVLARALATLLGEVRLELRYWDAENEVSFDEGQAETIVRHFAAGLPEIRALIDSDVEAAFLGDPAARSVDEILICYPCALAIIHHRLAHRLHGLGAPLVARIVSELANSRTGIDIHPGAAIGPSFFIDHGTGVVIGETAVIGARVRLYQQVTLGARRLKADGDDGVRRRFARHPIIEDDVVIYAGATILGRITIGRDSTIGGNVWLVQDVPPNSLVTQGDVQVRISRHAPSALDDVLAPR